MSNTRSSWSDRNQEKETLRQHIWNILKTHKATYQDPAGHIPNFQGADVAAEQLASTQLWQQAQVVKCNPDSPHTPVRQRVLAAGKTLYVAVPRLTQDPCFVELTAANLAAKGVPLSKAATAQGAMTHGKPVTFAAMRPIDVVVVGCVAVALNGGRTGKGAGFADLELAMLRECDLISATTPIVTTVHGLQIVAASEVPMQSHDWGIDLIATPTQCFVTDNQHPRPTGLEWTHLQPDQLADIPILRRWLQQPS